VLCLYLFFRSLFLNLRVTNVSDKLLNNTFTINGGLAQLATRLTEWHIRAGSDKNMNVYILKSLIDGSHYVGMSDNPVRRLEEHNRGKVTSTKAKIPWEKIYEEEC
jgi:hypothetical protein